MIAERAELLAKGDALRSELATASARLADPFKQVGNPEHLKVFADAAAAETWFVENLAALGKGRASSASNKRAAFEYEVPE